MSVELLEKAVASTQSILARVEPGHLDAPTPCASWSVRDVVNHIVESVGRAAETVEIGRMPDPAPGGTPDVTGDDMVHAYVEATRRGIAAFEAPGAMEKSLTLPFGDLPGSAFVLIIASDQFQHGWDLAKATGQPTDLDPELAEQLLGFAHAALAESFRGEDGQAPFGPAVEVPESAGPVDRYVAFLGRTP